MPGVGGEFDRVVVDDLVKEKRLERVAGRADSEAVSDSESKTAASGAPERRNRFVITLLMLRAERNETALCPRVEGLLEVGVKFVKDLLLLLVVGTSSEEDAAESGFETETDGRGSLLEKTLR